MRAIFVLATILSFGTPQVSWSAMEFSSATTSSMSLATPAPSQIVRPIVKTDKSVSVGGALISEYAPHFPPIGSIDYVSAQTCDAPHLDLEGPPLAPRPPPFN